MVVPHHVVVGVSQRQGQPPGPDRQPLRDRQPRPAKPRVPQLHPQEARIGGEGAFQPEPQVSPEKLPVILGREGESLRVPHDAGVGPLAVEDQVVRLGQLFGQCHHLFGGVRLVGRKLPHRRAVQPRDELVPVVVADHPGSRGCVLGKPFPRPHRGVLLPVYVLESQGIEHRGQDHHRQEGNGSGEGGALQTVKQPGFPGSGVSNSCAAGDVPSPLHQPPHHPARQQEQHRRQRENIAEEAYLEGLQEKELGDHPRQQQQVPAAGRGITPCHQDGERDAQPRGNPQRNPQPPDHRLP